MVKTWDFISGQTIRGGAEEKIRFFSRKECFDMQHFRGVLAIVSSEDMGLHRPARRGVEKFRFFREGRRFDAPFSGVLAI